MTKAEALEGIFAAGHAPTPEQFLGPGKPEAEWEVVMLTGPILSMHQWPLKHRKRFWKACTGAVRGFNLIGRKHEFGYFDVLHYRGMRSTYLDYQLDVNGLMHPVHDMVRTTLDPNRMIGKFFYGERFVGYFWLVRLTA